MYVGWYCSKNGCQKDMCSKEVGLRARDMMTILSYIVNIIEDDNFFALTMYKIFT